MHLTASNLLTLLFYPFKDYCFLKRKIVKILIHYYFGLFHISYNIFVFKERQQDDFIINTINLYLVERCNIGVH